MPYFVTLCTSDQDAGSNPFWHSCLLFSKMNPDEHKMEVVDDWGYTTVPSTGDKNSFISYIKDKWFRFNYDLMGNHGILCKEKRRFLDRGCGLHGVTFELTEEKFNELQQKCKKLADEQEAAIKEAVEALNLQPKPKDKQVIYPYEDHSLKIFEYEKAKARRENRPSRIKHFEFPIRLGLFGEGTNTCKSQIVTLLEGILTEEQIARITVNGMFKAFPRFCGTTEDMYLYSEGPLSEHIKADGERVLFRDSINDDIKLFWTLPPQEVETLSDETRKLLEMDKNLCPQFKNIAKKLHGLYWLVLNAQVPDDCEDKKNLLIERIVQNYKGLFAEVKNSNLENKDDWCKQVLSFFCVPRKPGNVELQERVDKYQLFFDKLYGAAVSNTSSEDEETEAGYYIGLETVAAQLVKKDKVKLCEILGKTYSEKEPATRYEQDNSRITLI